MSVAVRVARDETERLASIEVVVEAFGVAGPMWLLQAKRLASLLRSRAAWWVAEVDGRIVGATLSYPLRFAGPDGRIRPGYGIGALVTRSEARRQGVARALVEAAGNGAGIGLLYSAIPPAYYGKLGFRVVPAWDHLCADPTALAAGGPHTLLRPIDPRLALEHLVRVWSAGHAGLHLHRDATAWELSLAEHPDDLFFAAGDGYVRLRQNADDLEVAELFGTDPAPALRAVGAFAAELATSVRGWFDPVPDLAGSFVDRGRGKTLPMVQRWDTPEDCRFWSSDYF